MDILRCITYLLVTLSMVECLLVKTSVGVIADKDLQFEGLDDSVSSPSFSTGQPPAVIDRRVENSNIDELMTNMQLQLLLSALPNQQKKFTEVVEASSVVTLQSGRLSDITVPKQENFLQLDKTDCDSALDKNATIVTLKSLHFVNYFRVF
jgi:hypothetical protein